MYKHFLLNNILWFPLLSLNFTGINKTPPQQNGLTSDGVVIGLVLLIPDIPMMHESNQIQFIVITQ